MSPSSSYHRTFLAILVAAITIAFIVVVRGFLVTVMLAAIFTSMVYPGYRVMLSWCRGRQRVAAGVYVILLAFLVIIPTLFLLSVMVAQGIDLSSGAGTLIQEQVKTGKWADRLSGLPFMDRVLEHRETILEKSVQVTAALSRFVVTKLTAFTKGTVAVVVHIFLIFYSMYYFLIDGHHLLRTTSQYLPLSPSERARLINRFAAVSVATIRSTVLIGVIQGTLGGVGFATAGLPGSVFWGAMMMVLSIVPGIGIALVWVPAAAYLLIMGRITALILFALYFTFVVGLVDNLLRPILVGKGSEMHELLVLLSTLGGIVAFGVLGFIIGPVIAALFITLWEIQGAPVQESTDVDDA
ncbi:MAG TPA: AI-2E family transporter [Candidatus Krumholzibacteria bacterium]